MIQYTVDIRQKILSNPAMAGLLGFLSVLFSVWTGYRALRVRKLSYRRIDIPYLKTSIVNSGLIQADKEQSVGISSAEIAVWNSGRKYINSSDMARKEPLRIIARNNSKIITGKLLFASCEYCDVNCRVNENHKEILTDFDYLEREEGCIVNVIYDGNKEDIQVLGVIKGTKQIKKSQSIMEIFKKIKLYITY